MLFHDSQINFVEFFFNNEKLKYKNINFSFNKLRLMRDGPVPIYAFRYAQNNKNALFMIDSYDIWLLIVGSHVIFLHEKSFNFHGYLTLMIVCMIDVELLYEM